MSVTVRPHTKMMSAVLAAGVVVAAAPAWVPEAQEAAATVSTQAVQPAGFISDFLENIGYTVAGIGNSIVIPIDAAISAPFDAFSALLVGLQTSEYRNDVASWLVNRYLNPSDLYADQGDYWIFTYPNEFKDYGLGNLIALLPPSAQAAITNFVNGIADRINSVLGDLADPVTGDAVMNSFFWDTGIGRVVNSVNAIPMAPIRAILDTVNYAGWLPYELFSTLEAAVQDPRDIPGLISNLAWGLLGEYGLLGNVIHDLSFPVTNLPGLIGQISTQIVNGVYKLLNGVLSLLPDPVSPYSFEASRVADDELVGAGAGSTDGVFGAGATNFVTVSEGETPEPVETEPIAPEEVAPEAVSPEPSESEPVGSEVVEFEPAAPAAVEDDLTDDEDVAGDDRALDDLADEEDSSEPNGGDTGPANPSSSGGNQVVAEAEGPTAESGSESDSESDSGESAAAA